MNGYICYYLDRRVEVHARTTYEAQQIALSQFRAIFPRRTIIPHRITVMLAELAGEPYPHDGASL